MTLGDLLNDYLHQERSAVETIRMLSAVFNPEQAVNILAIVNCVTRVELGDLDRETFRSIFELEQQ